ncbi:threonine ammonia-lyase [Burkholderiaceae bacterium FT117]|uniref:threonine ammonia-lyase n=1 Tax=Zeimonas sediminis TaxID=2944268 RepID=UPI002342C458|nr:threonine ammonia-lyase [Zeimonas sediminis]MCM5571474.1 threonine ammonia-lyase [Zeimonas sediminis]
MIDFADIEAAAGRIRGQVVETPCLLSRILSDITGAQVFLKFENLQFTASFKERGALNRLSQLDEAQRLRGVIAVSAGNHAQGVAWHAKRLGIPATIVMPRFTPGVKVMRTREFGAEVVLHGERFDDAREQGLRLAAERGLTMIDPFDDDLIIAGQGTIGIEMLRAQPELDELVVPIGGGGLIGGIATAARHLKPGIRVTGVQTERFALVYDAIKGTRHEVGAGSIAEGIAVNRLGERTLPIIRERVDDVVLVGEGDIEQAILLLLEVEKTVVEGAGAAGLAALLRHPDRFRGRRVGLVLCGGNIDPLLLASIIERGMVRTGRLARLYVDIRDVPGALSHVTGILAEEQANIEQIRHERAFGSVGSQRVEVEIVVQTRGPEHVQALLARLAEAGFAARTG